MKKIYLLSLVMTMLCALGVKAQVTTEPSPLQEDSQDVVIYYHADQGNKGLMGVAPPTKVYAHTGVTVNGNDWQYAPTWGDNSNKYELIWVSENLWKLPIGNLREYYGVKDNETITKLAFVFRTADKSKEGKTSSNGDIFVDVVDSGLQIALSADVEGVMIPKDQNVVNFTVSSTLPAQLTLMVNGVNIASSSSDATTLTASYDIKSSGDYEVSAKAQKGDETAEVSNNYVYLGSPVEKAYPGGGQPVMGPVTNADGSVTFCFAAPGMENIVLVGSWNDYKVTTAQQMNYVDYELTHPVTQETASFRYFWTTIDGIGKTTDQYIYYFIANGTVSDGKGGSETINTKTCDPYARLVLDPWNDKYLTTDVYPNLPAYPFDVVEGIPVAVYQSNINDYDWQVKDFKLPEQTDLIIYELLFRDFTGTEGKAMGNGTVKKAIEKFDYLKNLGVNVIELLPIMEFNGNISWGYNPNFYFAIDKAYGTPDDYKEFIDLCHQNGIAVVLDMVFNQSDGLHPWYQMYGGPQYSPFYNVNAPHAYSVLNDWNQGYTLVQQQWADVIKYWLTEYNFDGFRFDLVKGLGMNDSYANNGDNATNVYNKTRVQEMAYLQSVIQSVKPGAYCINENLAGAQEENEMALSGEINWANVNNAACQFAMGYFSDSNMNRLYAPQDGRTWGSTVSYLESHDEQRLAYKQDQWGVEGVKGNAQVSMWRCGSAAAQMMMSPGSHMIWQFSEMGNAQNTKDNNGGNNTDPKIVNWNLLDNPYHKGLYDNYCELIEVRLRNPEMFTKDVNFAINCNSSNWNNGRSLSSITGNKELYTLVNPNVTGELTMTVNFLSDDNANYSIMTSSYQSNPSFDAAAKTVKVPANCYVVIGSNNLNAAGVESIISDGTTPSLQAYGTHGQVTVVNANGLATVYTIDGKAVGQISGNGSIATPSGLYIVKCGKDSVKVIVK